MTRMDASPAGPATQARQGASEHQGDRGSLASVARQFAAGTATAHQLHDAFLSANVFCEAGETPGFIALGEPGTGVIPVFTSEAELALARGAVAWFSTTGADLLGLLPDGYDIALDMAGDTPLRLRPSALRRATVVDVSWR